MASIPMLSHDMTNIDKGQHVEEHPTYLLSDLQHADRREPSQITR